MLLDSLLSERTIQEEFAFILSYLIRKYCNNKLVVSFDELKEVHDTVLNKHIDKDNYNLEYTLVATEEEADELRAKNKIRSKNYKSNNLDSVDSALERVEALAELLKILKK
jgi:predicted ATP-grasp superfamily ATP-dependent carboligase